MGVGASGVQFLSNLPSCRFYHHL